MTAPQADPAEEPAVRAVVRTVPSPVPHLQVVDHPDITHRPDARGDQGVAPGRAGTGTDGSGLR